MFEQLYIWIQNLVFYMVIITAVLNVVPGKEYQKYIRFYTGLVILLVILSPIMKICGIEDDFYRLYHDKEYEQEVRETKEQIEDGVSRVFSHTYPAGEEEKESPKRTIKVREVQIEP